MERTLLLSQNYEPLCTISLKKVLKLLSNGKIEIVEEYEDAVRTVSVVIKIPAVVRLVNAFRRVKGRVRYRKQHVFARDRWTCQYCGKRFGSGELTVDHVVPRAQGGKTEWENVVTSCGPCNSKKDSRTPEQAGMRLRSRPYRPDSVPVVVLGLQKGAATKLPEVWKPYCFGV